MPDYFGMSEKDKLTAVLNLVESMSIDARADHEHILEIKEVMREIKASVVRKYEKKE